MADLETRVRHKEDTVLNWETNDPVILGGELIIVRFKNGDVRFKIGDGVKNYSQLLFTDDPLYTEISGIQSILNAGTVGQVLSMTENGPEWIDVEDENDAMEMLAEMGVLDPVTDENGSILTDENGYILSI